MDQPECRGHVRKTVLTVLLLFSCLHNTVSLLLPNITRKSRPENVCLNPNTVNEFRDALCSCFTPACAAWFSGFSINISLENAFWKGFTNWILRNAQFRVSLALPEKHDDIANEGRYQDDQEDIELGSINCNIGESSCSRTFNTSSLSVRSHLSVMVYLTCDVYVGSSSPCDDCFHIQACKLPVHTTRPTQLIPTVAVTTQRTSMDIVIVLGIISVCIVLTVALFFVTGLRRRTCQHEDGHESTAPLVDESPTTILPVTVLLIDFFDENQDENSRIFLSVLRSIPNLTIIHHRDIDQMEKICENVNDWIDKSLKTCDYVMIILSPELCEMCDTDTTNPTVSPSSPQNEIVMRLLFELNELQISNTELPKYAIVQFDENPELSRIFQRKFSNMSLWTIFTVSNLTNISRETPSYRQMCTILQALRIDQQHITHLLHDESNHLYTSVK